MIQHVFKYRGFLITATIDNDQGPMVMKLDIQKDGTTTEIAVVKWPMYSAKRIAVDIKITDINQIGTRGEARSRTVVILTDPAEWDQLFVTPGNFIGDMGLGEFIARKIISGLCQQLHTYSAFPNDGVFPFDFRTSLGNAIQPTTFDTSAENESVKDAADGSITITLVDVDGEAEAKVGKGEYEDILQGVKTFPGLSAGSHQVTVRSKVNLVPFSKDILVSLAPEE